jgi:hypothetical protein
LVSATTPWIGGASHAHSAPITAPASVKPTTTVTAARLRETFGGAASFIAALVVRASRSSSVLKVLRVLYTVAGAVGRPPVGPHLHAPSPAALRTEPRWLETELSRRRDGAACGFASVDVEVGGPHQINHHYRVALSALIGICRSSSSSRSDSAGRPSVVR